VIRTNLR